MIIVIIIIIIIITMAWDVTVPDTYAESHIGSTATKPGVAAQNTAQNKIDKYSKLANTHNSIHLP